MEALAASNGSHISAAMFGALAGANVLPFARDAFEATIRSEGKGVEPSLKAFSAAYDSAGSPKRESVTRTPPKRFDDLPADAGHPALNALVARIRTDFPADAQPMLFAGVKKVVDFQDAAYADDYLNRMVALLAADNAAGGSDKDHAFTLQAAKYVAVAMAYDDIFRVADLKVRGSRFERVRQEVGAKDQQIVYTTEYMHPRMEEVCGSLHRALGEWIEARPRLYKALDRIVNRGRRVRTGTIVWFAALYMISGLKSRRRATLRHAREIAHLEAWLATALRILSTNYDLAVQVLAARRLVKGYSDTHARGLSKFDRVLSALPLLVDRTDGAAWMRRLIQAALLDEAGLALDGALKTIETL
jgi:indolepyruvate ferredoxin oxidoreductase beta subunit